MVALPLAVIGLGGVLSLLLLHGRPPAEQALDDFVQGTSRPTLVSAYRSRTVAPATSDAFGRVEPDEARLEGRDAVRTAPGSTTAEPSSTEAAPPVVEDRGRRDDEPRTHRHRPSSSAPRPSVTTTGEPSVPASTSTPSATVDPTPTATGETVTPEPVPPSSEPVPAPVPPSSVDPAPESASP